MKYRVWVTLGGKTRMDLETSSKRLANETAANYRRNGVEVEVSWVLAVEAA